MGIRVANTLVVFFKHLKNAVGYGDAWDRSRPHLPVVSLRM